MADRDLLNKPLPLVLPEERNLEKKGLPAPVLGKLGVQVRARQVGTEADAPADTAARPEVRPEDKHKGGPRAPTRGGQPSQAPAGGGTPAVADKAYKAAYFNQDVQATSAPNLRARPLAALRGEEGAADLKKVVLPPPARDEAPRPEVLGAALERMQPTGAGAPDLPQLLARHNAWTQSEGMTPEKLLARMQELEAMVAARRAALDRMAQLTPGHLSRAQSLAQAFLAQGNDVTGSPTLAEDADALVQKGHDQAEGLHLRLKKVMGIKSR